MGIFQGPLISSESANQTAFQNCTKCRIIPGVAMRRDRHYIYFVHHGAPHTYMHRKHPVVSWCDNHPLYLYIYINICTYRKHHHCDCHTMELQIPTDCLNFQNLIFKLQKLEDFGCFFLWSQKQNWGELKRLNLQWFGVRLVISQFVMFGQPNVFADILASIVTDLDGLSFHPPCTEALRKTPPQVVRENLPPQITKTKMGLKSWHCHWPQPICFKMF